MQSQYLHTRDTEIVSAPGKLAVVQITLEDDKVRLLKLGDELWSLLRNDSKRQRVSPV